MKKCFSLFLIVACMLSGCHREGSWEFQYEVERVTQIKLVDMHTEWEYSVIQELEIGSASDLFSDIRTLNWRRYGPNLATPRGICILFLYDNGEYDIVSYHEPKHYRIKDGVVQPFNTWLCCDQEAFEAIVNKYLK